MSKQGQEQSDQVEDKRSNAQIIKAVTINALYHQEKDIEQHLLTTLKLDERILNLAVPHEDRVEFEQELNNTDITLVQNVIRAEATQAKEDLKKLKHSAMKFDHDNAFRSMTAGGSLLLVGGGVALTSPALASYIAISLSASAVVGVMAVTAGLGVLAGAGLYYGVSYLRQKVKQRGIKKNYRQELENLAAVAKSQAQDEQLVGQLIPKDKDFLDGGVNMDNGQMLDHIQSIKVIKTRNRAMFNAIQDPKFSTLSHQEKIDFLKKEADDFRKTQDKLAVGPIHVYGALEPKSSLDSSLCINMLKDNIEYVTKIKKEITDFYESRSKILNEISEKTATIKKDLFKVIDECGDNKFQTEWGGLKQEINKCKDVQAIANLLTESEMMKVLRSINPVNNINKFSVNTEEVSQSNRPSDFHMVDDQLFRDLSQVNLSHESRRQNHERFKSAQDNYQEVIRLQDSLKQGSSKTLDNQINLTSASRYIAIRAKLGETYKNINDVSYTKRAPKNQSQAQHKC
jgi:hypothetical protein